MSALTRKMELISNNKRRFEPDLRERSRSRCPQQGARSAEVSKKGRKDGFSKVRGWSAADVHTLYVCSVDPISFTTRRPVPTTRFRDRGRRVWPEPRLPPGRLALQPARRYNRRGRHFLRSRARPKPRTRSRLRSGLLTLGTLLVGSFLRQITGPRIQKPDCRAKGNRSRIGER
jgi:hypothetical protein